MIIRASGHPRITARHPTTLALTRDSAVTEKGDCFVACSASYELSDGFREHLRNSKKVVITISCGGESETIIAQGHPELNPSGKDLVVRTSDWIDGRTLAIKADKAAKNLKRSLVEQLRLGKPVEIKVEPIA